MTESAVTAREAMDQIRAALSGVRIPATPGEYDLHKLVAEALTRAEIAFQHEAVIASRCRADFLIGRVAVEVKQGKHSPKRLREQAARYLASPLVDGLLFVTTRGAFVPGEIGGKPVEVFGLARLWGVALP